jgi:protein phosphatase
MQPNLQPMEPNKKNELGPFDIIGDIHGCFDELKQLLEKLHYTIKHNGNDVITHPKGRRLVFVGDLVDRGPNSPDVLRLVMNSVAAGTAFCVNGNHEDKLKRKLMGKNVSISHGLQETLDQLHKESAEFKAKVLEFLQGLVSHYVFDNGKLAVVHAGLKEKHLGHESPGIRACCMYGPNAGKLDESGLPIRYPWAKDYCGKTLVVYGHTPISAPKWLNNTLNIDTGCVFGGKLTALRYPENTLVSVDAAKIYCPPKQAF